MIWRVCELAWRQGWHCTTSASGSTSNSVVLGWPSPTCWDGDLRTHTKRLSVRLIGGVAVLIGSILLGVMTIRTRIVPWWCGVLLIVAFPLGDLSNAIVSGGEGILLGILWGSVGYALLSLRGTVAEQSPA
jgi:hypothetical protein